MLVMFPRALYSELYKTDRYPVGFRGTELSTVAGK